eukprot:TRINITY_DN2786_c0_g3_i2.p5 TRINITY_DN2786_c0_g3~~TRINITY_DN2786_c0_g3_i2.p5  ORF type:complete len:143 (+),score=2.02 TRINITY_DN2786_c0_g3_i2:1120-1548(+)
MLLSKQQCTQMGLCERDYKMRQGDFAENLQINISRLKTHQDVYCFGRSKKRTQKQIFFWEITTKLAGDLQINISRLKNAVRCLGDVFLEIVSYFYNQKNFSEFRYTKSLCPFQVTIINNDVICTDKKSCLFYTHPTANIREC